MTEFIMTRTELLASFPDIAVSVGITLLCGVLTAIVYRIGTDKPSKFMLISVLIIPTIVHAVIMMVNGNIGAGIAAAGAFSLVRFRSIPGSSRDISILFLGMAAGLVAGMGYSGYALALTVVLGLLIAVAERVLPSRGKATQQLKITIPEDMDYTGVFDEVIERYASSFRLLRVRTIRMGTMYELTYELHMKKDAREKEMMDELRCRNGNLNISYGLMPDKKEEML